MKLSVDFKVEEGGKKSPLYTLESDLNGEVSLADFLAFTKQSLVVIADQVLKEEQANGFDKTPVVIVDGKSGQVVTDVSPLGSIEFVARSDMKEIILTTYKNLLEKSPIWTGEYRAAHHVFLNGVEVAGDLASLTTWLATGPQFSERDLIRFVNSQPYARKLERYGVTQQRTKNRSATTKRKNKGTVTRVNQPNGVYYLTTRAIRTRFKKNSIIRFEFVSGAGIDFTDRHNKVNRKFKTGKNKKSIGRAYLYPSIVISVQESGVL